MPLPALFDVDGTLLLGHDDLSSGAMLGSLREAYGVELRDDAFESVDHLGQTAKRIAHEILRRAGLEDDAIDEELDGWCGRFSEAYLALLFAADTIGWGARAGAAEALKKLELAVGDTPRDVSSAHEAGLRSLVIRSSRATRAARFDGADAVVDAMDSRARIVLAWAGQSQTP